VAEITVKRLLCCGFRRTGKAMGHVYQCCWRICREINAFSGFEYHFLCFIYICDLFTDSPSYIMAPEPISPACFINPSHQSASLFVYLPIVARQRLGKNTPILAMKGVV
jgi:hypothetical protein